MTNSIPSDRPKIVFVTDRGLVRQTAFALWGAIRRLSIPVDIHFWGTGLTSTDWNGILEVAATRPDLVFVTRDMDEAKFENARGPQSYISAATMGRLFIPREINGRALYIDGDCRIVQDLAPLLSIDLEGNLIAAARDYVVSKICASGERAEPEEKERISALKNSIDPDRYFNAGVVLFDCDTIRANPSLINRVEDIERASQALWGDQDHLNEVFNGKTLLLNPAFNSSWGRAARHRNFIKKIGGGLKECASKPNSIVHFHGSQKPWLPIKRHIWSRRAREALAYRKEAFYFEEKFPKLSFIARS